MTDLDPSPNSFYNEIFQIMEHRCKKESSIKKDEKSDIKNSRDHLNEKFRSGKIINFINAIIHIIIYTYIYI